MTRQSHNVGQRDIHDESDANETMYLSEAGHSFPSQVIPGEEEDAHRDALEYLMGHANELVAFFFRRLSLLLKVPFFSFEKKELSTMFIMNTCNLRYIRAGSHLYSAEI